MLKEIDRELAKDLMRKFHRNNIWGKHHWSEDTLPKGFPPHLRGSVIDVAEELRKMRFLTKRPSHHGYQWYANLEMIKDVL